MNYRGNARGACVCEKKKKKKFIDQLSCGKAASTSRHDSRKRLTQSMSLPFSVTSLTFGRCGKLTPPCYASVNEGKRHVNRGSQLEISHACRDGITIPSK